MLGETHLAWLAGFLDGEGSFSVRENSPGMLAWRIEVCNADLKSMEHVHQMLNFSSVKHHCDLRVYGGRRKDQYRICVSSRNDVVKLLRLVRPFLVTKAERASLIIALDSQKAFKAPLKKEDTLFVTKIRELNKRGVEGNSFLDKSK